MNHIDLRSDTLTQPTEGMWDAMHKAPVGDDVFAEDPSVNSLEALAAERTGKAAGLFVPTGTMGNLCAIMAHCGRGEEAIVGNRSHIFHWEAGGASVLGGVPLNTIPNLPNGELPLNFIKQAVRGDHDTHEAPTRLICLESTQNECGGPALSLAYMDDVREFAESANLGLHLDGARLFNAALALGVPVAEITARVDTVMFCLSKGLSTPVGSMLTGPTDLIQKARRVRKMLGGGMRQAGVLAAAGIYALEHMAERLAEDHQNARFLAESLASLPAVNIDLDLVQSNIVCFKLKHKRDGFIEDLAKAGLKISATKQAYRIVTHQGIERADVEAAWEILKTQIN